MTLLEQLEELARSIDAFWKDGVRPDEWIMQEWARKLRGAIIDLSPPSGAQTAASPLQNKAGQESGLEVERSTLGKIERHASDPAPASPEGMPDKSSAAVLSYCKQFLLDIREKCPELESHADVISFIKNEINPAIIKARKEDSALRARLAAAMEGNKGLLFSNQLIREQQKEDFDRAEDLKLIAREQTDLAISRSLDLTALRAENERMRKALREIHTTLAMRIRSSTAMRLVECRALLDFTDAALSGENKT